MVLPVSPPIPFHPSEAKKLKGTVPFGMRLSERGGRSGWSKMARRLTEGQDGGRRDEVTVGGEARQQHEPRKSFSVPLSTAKAAARWLEKGKEVVAPEGKGRHRVRRVFHVAITFGHTAAFQLSDQAAGTAPWAHTMIFLN